MDQEEDSNRTPHRPLAEYGCTHLHLTAARTCTRHRRHPSDNTLRDARSWTRSPQAAGLEAWFESYSESYYAKKMTRRVAPFAFKVRANILQEFCQIWWEVRTLLAARGKIGAAPPRRAGQHASQQHAPRASPQ